MDKEKLIMDFLYLEYGHILESYGYKTNKYKNKYKIKTKNNLSEISFLFSKRSNILHLIFSYTNLEVGKLHTEVENQIRIKENLLQIKDIRPTFVITDWKNIFTLYNHSYQEMTGWFFPVDTIEKLKEKTKTTYPEALNIISNLNKKFQTLDGLLEILWESNKLNTHISIYDSINILSINKLKSAENLEKSYQDIVSCQQFKNLTKENQQTIEKYFNALRNI